MNLTLEKVKEAAAAIGIAWETAKPPARPQWVVRCSHPGCHQKISMIGTPQPEDSLRLWAYNRGWLLDGKTPLCAEHAREARKSKDKKVTTIGNPAPKVARQVFILLEEHFLESPRRYADGWSDQRIAKETGVALDAVVRIRREAYGELAEPPAVTALRSEIQALREQIEEGAKSQLALIAELTQRLEGLPGATKSS